jgi:hypothetical protein
MPLESVVDIEPLGLSPGQNLALAVWASDYYHLQGEGPNQGVGKLGIQQIVTPEVLRENLEKAEIKRRLQLGALIREVEKNREAILGLDFGQSDAAELGAEPGAAPAVAPGAGAEPGDEPGDAATASAEQRLALRMAHLRQAMQQGRKHAHETSTVAGAVEDVRLQYLNNRLEDLIQRLGGRVVDPLRQIADEMFPVLETRLEEIEAHVGDDQLGREKAQAAWTQAEAIVRELRKVRDELQKGEDLKQLREMLRKIIQDQEDIGDRAKERKKDIFRSLSEE